jgi:signal peptidase I
MQGWRSYRASRRVAQLWQGAANLWYKNRSGIQRCQKRIKLAAADEGNDTSTAQKWFFETRYWLRDLILSVLLAFIVIVFLYQPVQVEGTSMMPRLENHERIFINKFLYRFRPIERGDVVVFRYPLDTSKSYIKRVIGLPGDDVSIRDGRVLVNGRPLREPYVLPSYVDEQNFAPVHVEPNHYYVLGDHRTSSNDSREWGTVDRQYVYGKAVFVYWPLGQFGWVN